MITEAILKINPNAEVNVSGDDINQIVWHDGTTPIAKADIQAKINETQYQRDRTYPSIQEQLDMQYWDNVNGTTTWKDAIAKVKSDNPKE